VGAGTSYRHDDGCWVRLGTNGIDLWTPCMKKRWCVVEMRCLPHAPRCVSQLKVSEHNLIGEPLALAQTVLGLSAATQPSC
jgi:hypothetical protein